MELYRLIEKCLTGLLQWVWRIFIGIHEIKNIVAKRHLIQKVRLTDAQKKQIDAFYLEHYGKKVPYWWHRLYTGYTGEFDYKYLPEYLFSMVIEPKSNKRVNVLPLENKNMLESVFVSGDNMVRVPETYMMCVDGHFVNKDKESLTKEEAICELLDLCEGDYQAVIKATVDTSSGRDIRMIQVKERRLVVDGDTWENLFEKMGTNFVIQERIKPHQTFAELYAHSINTLRVISYRCGEKIYIAPIIMRIGQGGGVVDNAHAGGMFIGVTDDGKLMPEAFTEYQKRYRKHPDTGIVFDGYQLPKVQRIKECAQKMHMRTPMLDFISWDFTLDEQGEIVLIEANLHAQAVWVSQIAHGKTFFDENAEAMLKYCRERK